MTDMPLNWYSEGIRLLKLLREQPPVDVRGPIPLSRELYERARDANFDMTGYCIEVERNYDV